MAVLNVRLDDATHEDLKGKAEEEGVSVSEYVRSLVLERVQPVRDEPGDQRPPESLRLVDRKVLALLHRILGRLLPTEDAYGEDGDIEYQIERARVLEGGFTGEYWVEVAGMTAELSRTDSERVLDILDMFRAITFSIDRLEQDGETVSDELKHRLEFMGFDLNDALESQMLNYVTYLIGKGRWSELKPQIERNNDGNSHHLVLDAYMRMLTEYRRIRREKGPARGLDDYLLRTGDLERLNTARIHPSNR